MKKLLFVVIISALIIGCAKEDEETPPDTRTPQELILGEWDCTSWTQEGTEIENIEYYKMNYYLESDVQTFEFEYATTTDGVKWQGTYEFEENDSKIKTVFVSKWFWNGSAWQATTPDEDKTWDIDNLTANTLQLTYIVTAQGGTDYTFKMTLIK